MKTMEEKVSTRQAHRTLLRIENAIKLYNHSCSTYDFEKLRDFINQTKQEASSDAVNELEDSVEDYKREQATIFNKSKEGREEVN